VHHWRDFCRKGTLFNLEEFDLAFGGWIWKRYLFGNIFHPWSDFSWHSWGFSASIIIYYQRWVNFLKEGALGVRDPVI
jgi:hypothetical protein